MQWIQTASKHLQAIEKFYMSEQWCEASSVLRTQKY